MKLVEFIFEHPLYLSNIQAVVMLMLIHCLYLPPWFVGVLCLDFAL